MDTYNRRKWAPYTSVVEHFIRMAVRHRLYEVKGDVARKWHQETVKWLNEKCTPEERNLMVDFFSYSQSVRTCTNYKVTQQIYEICERYACDMGLWYIDENNESEVEYNG